MPTVKAPSTRRRRVLVAVAALTVAGGALGASTVWRRSFEAAYRAFRSPELLEQTGEQDRPGTVCSVDLGPGSDLDRRIALEFQTLDQLDIDDPDTAELAGLTTTDLPVDITRRTLRFVRFFGADPVGREAFRIRYRRAGRYRDVIQRQLREAGLPEDLTWLAAIESAFDAQAVSPAGAAGLWQFMPETAALYGLELSPWIDERKSPRRATEAAVIHLRDLFERLGTWDLALAAYNFGYDGVLRALREYVGQRADRGEPGDRLVRFTDLAQAQLLPLETADFVPKITAFAIVAANLARFDLDGVEPDEGLAMAVLSVPEGTRLRTVASAAGLPTAVLHEYNPQLSRDRVPPTGGDYDLTLPAERLSYARAALPAYLDHEVLLLEEGYALPAVPAGLELGRNDEPEAPLPLAALRRPAHLGPNRLPAFPVPGREPGRDRLKAKSLLATTDTTLPARFMGIRIGWKRPSDPFSLLRSSAEDGPHRPPVDPALDEQLAFLAAGPPARLPSVPYDETRLPGGVTLRLRQDYKAPQVAITVRLGEPPLPAAVGDPITINSREGEIRHTEAVARHDLDVGIHLAVGRLALLLEQSRRSPLAALRTELNRRRRQHLASRPHGSSWLALSEALFPIGSPHEGRIISPDPEDSALWTHRILLASLTEERSPQRATLSIVGPFDRRAAIDQVELAFALLRPGLGARRAADETPAGPRRVVTDEPGRHPQLLYGWPAPAVATPDATAVEVALYVLAGRKGSRFRRELVEPQLAATARGFVDPGWTTSAAAIELVPAATVEMDRLERRAESIIDDLATEGPSRVELAYAKAILTYRLRKRIAQLGQPPKPELARATLGGRLVDAMRPGFWQQALERLEQVDGEAVRRAARTYLTPRGRVAVVTLPSDRSGLPANERAAWSTGD